ncbi:hypothetical protein GX48_08125 [Paracoccidioides brasiliensis]|nr:hypothetical protein GX48_08125 [Paracoccidioides brasiliensis]
MGEQMCVKAQDAFGGVEGLGELGGSMSFSSHVQQVIGVRRWGLLGGRHMGEQMCVKAQDAFGGVEGLGVLAALHQHAIRLAA